MATKRTNSNGRRGRESKTHLAWKLSVGEALQELSLFVVYEHVYRDLVAMDARTGLVVAFEVQLGPRRSSAHVERGIAAGADYVVLLGPTQSIVDRLRAVVARKVAVALQRRTRVMLLVSDAKTLQEQLRSLLEELGQARSGVCPSPAGEGNTDRSGQNRESKGG